MKSLSIPMCSELEQNKSTDYIEGPPLLAEELKGVVTAGSW